MARLNSFYVFEDIFLFFFFLYNQQLRRLQGLRWRDAMRTAQTTVRRAVSATLYISKNDFYCCGTRAWNGIIMGNCRCKKTFLKVSTTTGQWKFCLGLHELQNDGDICRYVGFVHCSMLITISENGVENVFSFSHRASQHVLYSWQWIWKV